MRLPNFLVLGVPRAATTWLYNCLSVHPDVFVPKKELEFWSDSNKQSLDAYLTQFDGWRNKKACGDVSVGYFSSKVACEKIAKYIPNAKLIVILRDPVSSALSHYRKRLAQGKAPVTFEDALVKEPIRYKLQGDYGYHMEMWRAHFMSEQMLVLQYERLKPNASLEFAHVCNFLGIQWPLEDGEEIVYESLLYSQPNRSYSVRSISLHFTALKVADKVGGKVGAGIRKVNRIINFTMKNSVKVQSETLEELRQYYKDSNEKLVRMRPEIDLELWSGE